MEGEAKVVVRKETNWDKASEWLEQQQEGEEHKEWKYIGEAYDELREKMDKQWTRTVTIMGRSKR